MDATQSCANCIVDVSIGIAKPDDLGKSVQIKLLVFHVF